jgi:rubrerythrin
MPNDPVPSGKAGLHAETIIKIAISIEKNGHLFYENLGQKFNDPGLLKVFQTMAEDEIEHQSTYENFYEVFARENLKDDISTEDLAAVSSLSESHIFNDEEKVERRLSGVSSPADAIDMAIEFEKDSVVFFTAMRDYVFKDEAGIIDRMAKEEMAHVVRLLELKNELLNQRED